MTTDLDTCDRCGKESENIGVGWFSETGYDGLCDDCLRVARSK